VDRESQVTELVTRIFHTKLSSLPIHYEPGEQTFVTHRIGSTELERRRNGAA
jgi:hypothetical protein